MLPGIAGGRKLAGGPAGRQLTQAQQEWEAKDFVLVAAIRRLAIDFISKLNGQLMAGRHRVGGVVDVRSVLNHHLRVLLGAGYGSHAACVITDTVDELVEAGGLPRRIDLRWQSGAFELQDWLSGLH